MQIKKVNLTYYKSNGNFYCTGQYTSAKDEWAIAKEVRGFKAGQFPGLSKTSDWDGYILVVPENGVSSIVDFGG